MIISEIPLGQAFAVLPVHTQDQLHTPSMQDVIGPDLPEPPPPPSK